MDNESEQRWRWKIVGVRYMYIIHILVISGGSSQEDGGVRTITVGCVLCVLITKVTSRLVRDEMASFLGLKQLSFGEQGGAEAAVHAVRRFLSKMPVDHGVVKLDF